ncbi:hypothetical protein BACI349Y_810017 [Bacillus sp. 349Y]|nr:hypothetical protein BACI349Y_810017 [Bacillus sp. 349Y]
MSFEIVLNKLYKEIAQQVNDMIPFEWDNFYFNDEVKEEFSSFLRPKVRSNMF